MRISEVRHGRNFIRAGDLVRVKPSRSGKHDGFTAKFLYSNETGNFALQELDYSGSHVAFRFIEACRIKRLATTRHQAR